MQLIRCHRIVVFDKFDRFVNICERLTKSNFAVLIERFNLFDLLEINRVESNRMQSNAIEIIFVSFKWLFFLGLLSLRKKFLIELLSASFVCLLHTNKGNTHFFEDLSFLFSVLISSFFYVPLSFSPTLLQFLLFHSRTGHVIHHLAQNK